MLIRTLVLIFWTQIYANSSIFEEITLIDKRLQFVSENKNKIIDKIDIVCIFNGSTSIFNRHNLFSFRSIWKFS